MRDYQDLLERAREVSEQDPDLGSALALFYVAQKQYEDALATIGMLSGARRYVECGYQLSGEGSYDVNIPTLA